MKGITATGMQSNYGFEGQINACWTHKVTQTEIELIRSAAFLVSVIHGRCISQLFKHCSCLFFFPGPIFKMSKHSASTSDIRPYSFMKSVGFRLIEQFTGQKSIL